MKTIFREATSFWNSYVKNPTEKELVSTLADRLPEVSNLVISIFFQIT